MNCRKEDMVLYAITDRHWLNGESLYQQVEKALQGGVTFLQLREKNLDKELFMKEAREIKELCRKYKVPFIINDNVENNSIVNVMIEKVEGLNVYGRIV